MAEEHGPGQEWDEFERRCASFREEMNGIRAEISALEARREDTREQMRRTVISYGYDLRLTAAVPVQNRLIRQIYWHAQDVPTEWIADAFGRNVYEVVHIAGKSESELSCIGCGKPLVVASRDELKRLQREQRNRDRGREQGPPGTLLCWSCWKTRCDELDAAREQNRRTHSAHLDRLRSLPYAEYLKTPEWRDRRNTHLEEVDNRCQVCGLAGNGQGLSVRHRSRKNLGDEVWDDLIALCDKCDALFRERLQDGQVR
jgi:hypothetical protein